MNFNESKTHYIACFHVSPRRLLTAAPILKTKEANQKQLTEFAIGVRPNSYENCIVVAVTAEKKVATVERLSRLFAPCSCANRMVGTPCGRWVACWTVSGLVKLTNFNKHRKGWSQVIDVLAHFSRHVVDISLHCCISELTWNQLSLPISSEHTKAYLRKPLNTKTSTKLPVWVNEKLWTSESVTLRSPSNDKIDALTASSVNSGNSFKQRTKVVTSFARNSSCSGNVSGSTFSDTVGLGTWSCALPSTLLNPRRRRDEVGESLLPSRAMWTILRGKRSAAFSW